jgi:hypothetical protein
MAAFPKFNSLSISLRMQFWFVSAVPKHTFHQEKQTRVMSQHSDKMLMSESSSGIICRGADKSLAFPISHFPICSTTKRFFLGWVKEVRTTKS